MFSKLSFVQPLPDVAPPPKSAFDGFDQLSPSDQVRDVPISIAAGASPCYSNEISVLFFQLKRLRDIMENGVDCMNSLDQQQKRMRLSILSLEKDVAEAARLYSKYCIRVSCEPVCVERRDSHCIAQFQLEGDEIPPSTGQDEDTISVAFRIIAKKWALSFGEPERSQVSKKVQNMMREEDTSENPQFVPDPGVPPRQERNYNGLQHHRTGIRVRSVNLSSR
jgi:hypothetical protein